MSRCQSSDGSGSTGGTIILVILFYLFYVNIERLNSLIDMNTGTIRKLFYGIIAATVIYSLTIKPETGTAVAQPKKVTQFVKNNLYIDQSGKCNRCRQLLNKSNYLITFKTPIENGGSHHPSNYQALCRQCHHNVVIEHKMNNLIMNL